MPKKKEHKHEGHERECDEDIEKLLNEVEEKEEAHATEEERVEDETFEEE